MVSFGAFWMVLFFQFSYLFYTQNRSSTAIKCVQMASANDGLDEKIEIAAESDSESSDEATESSVSGFETTPK